MEDNLEQLVKNSKATFDDQTPNKKVWKKIAKRLDGSHSNQWVWKAAAVLFFVTSLGLATQVDFNKTINIAEQKQQINSDFKDVELFYFNLISEKKSLINDFETAENFQDQAFEQDLKKLDAMYQVLKEELKANPSKKVVDALILNLLVRIDVLNKELESLDESNDKEMEGKGVNI